MRIGINARLLDSPSLRGWNRYAVNLVAQLHQCGVETMLYSDRAVHPAHLERLREGSYTVRVAPTMKYLLWEQNWLPRQCKADGIALLHSPFHFGLPYYSHCPRVVTLHDAIDTNADAGRFWKRPGYMLNTLSRWIARDRAHHVITVSGHSKQDLVEQLAIPPERISVIYEAADPVFSRPVSQTERAAIRARYQLCEPFFFYIGGLEARKNLPFLIEAFAAADLKGVKLVLGGSGDTDALSGIASANGLADTVHFLGPVPDADLPLLYAEALAFVYPSRYEGFGLQLCEAMRMGCPVLAARASCLPEILGDGGETFGLKSTAELAQLLRAVASNAEYRRQLAERAKRRSGDFDWQRTAQETVAVYRSLTS